MTRRPSTWRVLLVSWAVLLVGSVLWALATPIGGSPDEPAHLVKAASVVRGEFVGTPTEVGHEVTVPQYIAWSHAWTCYAFNSEVPASCTPPMPGEPDALVTSVTMAGLYNPVYYLLVGWPSLIFHDDSGIYAMRIVSALISTFFVAAAISLIARWRRPVLPLVGVGVIVTPMVMFLIPAVNPNALEVTTTLAVIASMYTLLRERPDSRWAVVLVTISAAIGVTARGLSPLWIAIALLAPLLLVPFKEALAFLRRRDVLIGAGVIALATIGSLGWTLASNSLTAGATDPDIQIIYPGAGSSPISGFLYILARTFDYGAQMIGLFAWMDTWAPAFVLFVYAVLIGALLFIAAVVLRGRALLQVLVLAAALVFLPAIIQAAYVTAGGYIWQGRYSLPIYAMLILAATTMLSDRWTLPSRTTVVRGVWLLVAALAASHLLSFVVVLKRFTVGSAAAWGAFLRDPEWVPPLGTIGLLVAFALLALVAAVLGGRALLRAASTQREQVDGDADDRTDRETEHHTV